jgi:hypothetical protein
MPPQKKHHGHHLAHPVHRGDGNETAKKPSMKVDIPRHDPHISETEALRTPKTPQNEGLSWFKSHTGTQPLQVYELALEADGGPNKDRAVSCFPTARNPRFVHGFMINFSYILHYLYKVYATSVACHAVHSASLPRGRYPRLQRGRSQDQLSSLRWSL